MKKGIKITLIIAAVCASLGIICVLIGTLVLGANWSELFKYVHTKNSVSVTYEADDLEEAKDLEDVIEDVVENHSDSESSHHSSIHHGENHGQGSISSESQDGITEYTFDPVTELDLNIAAGSLYVQTDDVNKIKVQIPDTVSVDVYSDDATLYVDSTISTKSYSEDDFRKVVIILPEDLKLEEVSAEVSAGLLEMEALNAKEFDLDVEAGKITAEMPGKQSDYSYDLNCTAGQVKFGSDTYNGVLTDKELEKENAAGNIDISCGMGQVTVDFIG